MNVDPDQRPVPNTAWWQSPEIRSDLATRDIAAVFAFLRRRGVTQRTIASLTGLATSEVYEVTKGRRIMAYDVLCRIADGLSIPRGFMGLAYDDGTERLARMDQGPAVDLVDESSHLLSHAAAVTLGLAAEPGAPDWGLGQAQPTPLPTRIGDPDITQIETITATLRALDYEHGGGACREAVLAQTRWVATLLHEDMAEPVRRRLHVTLADLHNLAGWTSFDVGLAADARRHFAIALVHAREANEPSLTANILYRMGRLHLHQAMIMHALRYFQLGQIAAHDGAGAPTVALLCANEAWAYGMLGNAEQAARSLDRAEDELSRQSSADPRPWINFFGFTDLTALTGMTYLELAARPQPKGELSLAAEKLHASASDRGRTMPRSHALELAGLAVAHLHEGNSTEGLAVGHKAADLADQLRSVRVWQRFAPLAEAAQGVGSNDAEALSRRIQVTLSL